MITGFSVIGNIDGNHTTIYSSYNGNLDEFVLMIIEAYQNRNMGDKLIYSFPYAFIIGQEGSYKRIYAGGDIEVVEDIDKYDSHVTDMLREKASVYNADVSTQAETTYAELDHWAVYDFVPIDNNGYIYYGGHQNWLVAEGVAQSRANMACGLTASANAFYYMSQYVSGKANLYTKSNITKASFSAYQKELYDLSFTPDLGMGIPWLTALNTNARVWATSRNVSLAGNMSSSSWTYSQYLTHVVQGLRQERPVLLLTWGSPIEDLVNHWVTITRIYNDGNGTKIVTSNWHNKEIYDFDLWCASSSGNKGTLYFE